MSTTPTNMTMLNDFDCYQTGENDRCSSYFMPIQKLSPIWGSIDLSDCGGQNESDSEKIEKPRPQSATNELPLTELNLAIFTSELEPFNISPIMSTNELPMSDIKLIRQSTIDSQNSQNDDTSLEVNWESDNMTKDIESDVKPEKIGKLKQHRSFSDPNISSHKQFLLDKYNSSLLECRTNALESKCQNIGCACQLFDNAVQTVDYHKKLSLPEAELPELFLNSNTLIENNLNQDETFYDYPDNISFPSNCCCHCWLCLNRSPSNLLSFFTSNNNNSNNNTKRPGAFRSLSHPTDNAALSKQLLSIPTPPPHYFCPFAQSNCINAYCSSSSANTSAMATASTSGRRHRHSIAGQMSYYKMLGFGCGNSVGGAGIIGLGPLAFKKLVGGSTNSLFSTAVISGSSSAPNLRDMIPSTATASAIEGFGGVPPIRPLETLHNALSLRQIDNFLEQMTAAPIFRTPSSTPPKYPSTPLQTSVNNPPLKSPSNSVGWSGPSSCMSSSGPSSPGFSEANSKESSEMSSSIISADGFNMDNLNRIFPTVPGLDRDLDSVGKLLEMDREISGSMEFSEYYTSLQKIPFHHFGSGELTPVSNESEFEMNTNEATTGSTTEPDLTVTEEMETSIIEIDDNVILKDKESLYGKLYTKSAEVNKRNIAESNLTPSACDAPKISRISKSFHGKSINDPSSLNILVVPRRASEGTSLTGNGQKNIKENQYGNNDDCGSSSGNNSSLTENSSKNPRFTTIKVAEADHLASLKMDNKNKD